jgi:hypothetical protein
MKFIEVILKNSQIKEAKLFGPSKKASDAPETGVIIQNPAAYHVIKDCATLANKYLPHFVFGHYANPFEVLKGKFTKTDIVEFVEKANSDIVLYQLLSLILEKIKKQTGWSAEDIDQTATPNALTVNSTDPYGDYESYFPVQPQVKAVDTVTIICDAFGAINK